eukprot:scaffold230633_cov40-Tisochrysis_lutea.AAC.1
MKYLAQNKAQDRSTLAYSDEQSEALRGGLNKLQVKSESGWSRAVLACNERPADGPHGVASARGQGELPSDGGAAWIPH